MNTKNNLRDKAKSLWIKGMKAVGNTAASIANNTRYKVDEVTIQNRRREVLNDLAHSAYALWLKGNVFPEQMDKLLKELNQLDEQLNDMRAEKYALSGKPSQTPENAPEEVSSDDEEVSSDNEDEENNVSSAMTEESPVSTGIIDLFELSSVDRSAEKVNASLDHMSDRIRRFLQPETEIPEQKQE